MKLDLHTHSTASPDGALTEAHYHNMLDGGGLDYVAVTDHNTTVFAAWLHEHLGERIIIGEEVTTRQGEIIGLYLHSDIPDGQSALETVREIKRQGGLVYIPHPFETVRKGISLETLNDIAKYVDIIEVHNGRAVFQNKSSAAHAWAREHKVAGVASSDAHGWHGWGKTYTNVASAPTPSNLTRLLAKATYTVGSPGLRGVLYPKVNRLRKKVG
jgi:predicted metal-dependent phosphoesterase TrpH